MKHEKMFYVLVTALLVSLTACSDKKKGEGSDTKDTTAAATSQQPEATTPDEKKPAEEAAKETTPTEEPGGGDAPSEDDIPSEVEMPTKLSDITHSKKLPEAFEIDGEVAAVVGWSDKFGRNALVITTEDQKGKGDAQGKLMRAKHALQEGDGSWTEVRAFKELVDDCQFDITLEVFTGDWSVTDLDNDALGEVTFAYRAGCRSDVSPVAHKVLMTENGKKWALRGQSRIEIAGAADGGDFKPDFKEAPEGGLAHAKKVWEKTVTEKF